MPTKSKTMISSNQDAPFSSTKWVAIFLVLSMVVTTMPMASASARTTNAFGFGKGVTKLTKRQGFNNRKSVRFLGRKSTEEPCLDDNDTVFESLQIEYREMASWYDEYWKSYTRETLKRPLNLVMKELQKTTPSPGRQHKKKDVLVDVACGTGEFLRCVQEAFERDCENAASTRSQNRAVASSPSLVRLVGVEPSKEMLEQAQTKFEGTKSGSKRAFGFRRNNIFLQQSPAEHLLLPDSTSAHIVTCTNAFHFFRDKLQALGEMRRILSDKDGTLVITDWCNDYWMVRLYYWMQHLRWHWRILSSPQMQQVSDDAQYYPGPLSSSQLLELVKQAGFSHIEIQKYRVRVFSILPWGMQTLTATKNE